MNAYLKKQQAVQNAVFDATQDFMLQFCVDLMTIVLHKRGYGAERIILWRKKFATTSRTNTRKENKTMWNISLFAAQMVLVYRQVKYGDDWVIPVMGLIVLAQIFA